MRERKTKVYVASQTRHAEFWRELRADLMLGNRPVEITSTWIDEAGPGESSSLSNLWIGCIAQAACADWVIAYHEPGDVWKGVFVEIGAALAMSVPVLVVGDPPGSWIEHPLVVRKSSLGTALVHIYIAGPTRG